MALPNIELKRVSDETPVGAMAFTVSFTPAEHEGEEASRFVAIAHHPDTGVMTIGSSGNQKGADGYRFACANAAYELCVSVQAITKFRRMVEATRYAQ